MTSVRQILWPSLSVESRLEAVELALHVWRDRDLIKKVDWSKDTEIALEQARLLVDQESDRKRSAESKASIYLAVIAAIVPVLSSLLTDFFADDFTKLPALFQAVTIGLFVLGMLYLAASGIWSFRTLAVSAHTRVDAADIAKIWMEERPVHGLVRDLLISTRLNHSGANKKMDYIRMAHEFLLRTFLTFAALLLVIVLREPLAAAASFAMPWLSRVWAAAIA